MPNWWNISNVVSFIDVCYLRLDFEIFTIEGPTTTSTEIGGGICTDSFSVSVRY